MKRVATWTLIFAVFFALRLTSGWAAPEADGSFRQIPLEREADDMFWFVQSQYQDINEQVKPARTQRKGRSTSLRIVPVLMRTNLAGLRQREEALKKLGRLKAAGSLSIGREGRQYFPPYVARVTVGGVSRYRWFAENELHGRFGLGTERFHGLTPGTHKVEYEIWGDRGENFRGSLSVLVDEKALDPGSVERQRKRVQSAKRAVDRRPGVGSLQKHASALLKLAGIELERGGAKPSAVYPLLDEADAQVQRIPSMQQPKNWKPKRQTWKEYQDQQVRLLLGDEVKLLRKLGDEQALTRLAEIARRIQQAGGYAHQAYRAQAEIAFALNAKVGPTRDLLEKYVAERDRSVARARSEGQLFGTAFVNRKPDWPRALKGLAKAREQAPDDGYWDWYPGYVQEKERRHQRIDEIRFELSALARQVRQQRARWMDLLRLDMALFEAGDVLENKVAGQQLDASTRKARNALRADIQAAIDEQRRLMDEGFDQIRFLQRRVETQRKKSDKRRPDLAVELQRLGDDLTVVRLQFYDAAEWYAPHQLPKLMGDMNFDNEATPEVVKIVQAKAQLADARHLEGRLTTPSAVARDPRLDEPLIKGAVTARFNALQAVREVLAANPSHEEASAMARQMELYWLNRIGAKLEREKQVSLAAFGAYLENRGYDKNDRSGWWEGFKEYAAVAWSSGPISLGAGLPGIDMPWVIAEDVSITQTEVAKNLVALLAIKRLRKNGVTLAEIREITPEALAQQMVLHTAAQQPLPEAKARQMVRDIRGTFAELGELQALTDGKLVAFNLAMGRSHYGAVATEQSWGEYLGDAFSPRHLISLFGPSAIVKVGGKWVFAGRMAGSEIRAAEAAGQLMRGRDALAAGLRLEKLAESLASTQRGAWLRQKILADHAWFTQLPGWERFLRKGSAMVGTMIILGGTSHLAAESGIPGAVLLVDILSELAGEEILFDILSRAGTPARRLYGRVDALLEYAAKKQDDLAHFGRKLDELDELAASVRAGGGQVPRETSRRLDGICQASHYDGIRPQRHGLPAILGGTVDLAQSPPAAGLLGGPALLLVASSSATLVPGCPAVGAIVGKAIPGKAEEGARKATDDAIRALRRGDAAEAERALKTAEALMARSKEQVTKLGEKARRVKQALSRLKERQAEFVTEQLAVIKRLEAKRFADPDLYTGVAGRSVLEGDELLRQGDFDKALSRYRRARELQDAERLKLGARFTKEQEKRLDLIEARIALMVNTKKTLKAIDRARRSGPRVAADRAFSESEISSVLALFEAGKGKRIEGSLNAVFEVTDASGNKFIVKKVADEAEASTEVAAALLANKLGLSAPQARAVKATGNTSQYLLVSRSIKEGTDGVALKLSNATEPVAVALKDDYARQRVFRAWLGDSDGHLGNQLFAADGRLWQIDFGMGSLKADRKPKHFGESIGFGTEAEFMEAVVGLPHGRQAVPAARFGRPDDLVALDDFLENRIETGLPYQWMARMDEMVHYDDMSDTVEAILTLTRGGRAEELKKILRDSGHPDPESAFEVLKGRADNLKAVLKRRFADPIQTGSLVPLDLLDPLRPLEPSVDWMCMAA